MRLEDKFHVSAPPEKAWVLLNDVPRIVPCMPGAELVEVVGDDAWKAKIRVKVGPIALEFLADIVRDEIDEAGKRVTLKAKAREAKGRGAAQATIESSLATVEDGTDVMIVTDLALQGIVASYGRGVVEDISSQLTQQFAVGLAQELAEDQSVNGTSAAHAEADASANGVPAQRPAVPRQPAAPIGGLRLAFKALWMSFKRLLRGGKR